MTKPLRKFPIFTFDEFLAFYESRPDGEHWELIDGHPVMMNPPSNRHQTTLLDLLVFLDQAAERGGSRWIALPGIGVRNLDRPDSALIPDIVIRPIAYTESSYHLDAIAVLEVLSPGTKRRDRFWKKAYYQRLPTLKHYVIVHQDRILVELISRSKEWTEQFFKEPEQEVLLSAIGVSIPLDRICRRSGLL